MALLTGRVDSLAARHCYRNIGSGDTPVACVHIEFTARSLHLSMSLAVSAQDTASQLLRYLVSSVAPVPKCTRSKTTFTRDIDGPQSVFSHCTVHVGFSSTLLAAIHHLYRFEIVKIPTLFLCDFHSWSVALSVADNHLQVCHQCPCMSSHSDAGTGNIFSLVTQIPDAHC